MVHNICVVPIEFDLSHYKGSFIHNSVMLLTDQTFPPLEVFFRTPQVTIN